MTSPGPVVTIDIELAMMAPLGSLIDPPDVICKTPVLMVPVCPPLRPIVRLPTFNVIAPVALTVLMIVRPALSFKDREEAVNPPRVAIWFVPVSVDPAVELPDSVPAISVPVSLIVPAVAIRLTVPAPPSVTFPERVILGLVTLTAAALTTPVTVRSEVFRSVKPAEPVTAKSPRTAIVFAVPINVTPPVTPPLLNRVPALMTEVSA